jgi:hypothetical protein
MALNFRKSKKIGLFRIGLSKGGLSVSTGIKGLRVGANSKGAYTSMSIPKTGISTTQYMKRGKEEKEAKQEPPKVIVTNSKPSCPKCGGYKTIKNKAMTAIVGFIMIIFGAFLGFLVVPLFFIPVGLLLIVAAPFTNGRKWYCTGCHCKFEVAA